MIRVLHVVPALDGGGVENILLNYYTHMNRKSIRFDFIVFKQEKGALESTFEELGSKIYHIPSRREALFRSLKEMKEIIYYNKYDVVHAHQNEMAFIPLFYADKCNVRMRIAHSHRAYESENIVQKVERGIFSFLSKHYATDLFACGIDAGEWLYGEKVMRKNKVYIMNNAIDLSKFVFSEKSRKQKREELSITDKFVVGHVGRLSYTKNHDFIIKIFNEIYKLNRNAILLVVGRGELENEVQEQVNNLGLTKVVKFLGIRNDVPHLLQAMDVFLLPSRFEGLPVVLVETQAAGLKTIASDTITREVQVTNLITYKSLRESSSDWANEVLKYANGYERRNTFTELSLAGYDIVEEAKRYSCYIQNVIDSAAESRFLNRN